MQFDRTVVTSFNWNLFFVCFVFVPEIKLLFFSPPGVPDPCYALYSQSGIVQTDSVQCMYINSEIAFSMVDEFSVNQRCSEKTWS
mmetsp:Transcript_1157/g.2384  ORF Transcript_1157/g.2384 Transcript_1157/m.2384 type:complete len:85 (-) Transcript_1157:24-278(-)